MKRPDVIVIGAGPIGLETAAGLARAGQRVVIVDSGPIGATIAHQFPPATRFFSSPDRLEIAGFATSDPGQEKISREQYLTYLRNVVTTLRLHVMTFHNVQRITRGNDCFKLELKTRSGRLIQLEGSAVVIATGGTGRPRTLGIPGEQLPHVRHDLGDPHQYHGRSVLIIGGRNSACESALRCWRAGAKVHLSYRGPALHERVKYWIRPELAALIEEGHVTGHFLTAVKEITNTVARLHDASQGKDLDIEADDILLQIGYEQNNDLLNAAGVQLVGSAETPEFDTVTMESNVPGLYVAGTATAGTQERFGIFIENCHVHADRITAAITGAPPPVERTLRRLEEN